MVLVALGLVALGVFLIWLGTLGAEWYHFAATQLGTAVLISAALGLLWDWLGRRLLADEIYEKMNVGFDVRRWGLKELSLAWNDQRWADLFAKGPHVDVLLGYGQTWRGVAASGLEEFLKKKGNVLRVCLPDPAEDWLMVALGRRYNMAPDRLRERILEAARYFAELRGRGEAKVQIFFRAGEPVYGLYRFESAALITLYPHRKERSSKIPTLVVESGEMLDFVIEDFEAAITDAREVSNDEIQGTAGN